MAEHGGIHTIGIARIDGDCWNLEAITQAEMSPGFARIGGFVDSVADGEIGPVQPFAASNINNVGIGSGYRDGPNGLRRLVIENRIPGAAVIVRLPDSAVDLADVKNVRLGGHAGGSAGTASAKGADHAPVEILISILGNLLRGDGLEREKDCAEDREQEKETKDAGCNHIAP